MALSRTTSLTEAMCMAVARDVEIAAKEARQETEVKSDIVAPAP